VPPALCWILYPLSLHRWASPPAGDLVVPPALCSILYPLSLHGGPAHRQEILSCLRHFAGSFSMFQSPDRGDQIHCW